MTLMLYRDELPTRRTKWNTVAITLRLSKIDSYKEYWSCNHNTLCNKPKIYVYVYIYTYSGFACVCVYILRTKQTQSLGLFCVCACVCTYWAHLHETLCCFGNELQQYSISKHELWCQCYCSVGSETTRVLLGLCSNCIVI